MTETKSIAVINKQIADELRDPAIGRALLTTTFKGLSEQSMKQAIFEGVTRGFKFKDFLEKNVYAIPFKEGYSLVTSIDYARKVGMRSGVVGKSAPSFEFDEKKLVSCTITIKRRVGQDIGEFTATVYFDEFYRAGKNGFPSLWDSKPRVMLSKVCEMHALRMACPEEMSQVYTEEEFDKDKDDDYDHSDVEDDAVPTIHIGDDHGEPQPNLVVDRSSTVKEEQEIPEDDAGRKNLITALLIKKFPQLDLKDAKAVKTQIGDYTELEYTTANYEAIIRALR